MRPWSLVLVPLATVAIYGGCADDETTPASGLPAGYEDVLLEAGITDEALVAFTQALEAGPLDDVASQRAAFDWPADGEVLAKTPPSPFCWRIGATAGLDRPPRRTPRPASASASASSASAGLAWEPWRDRSAGPLAPLLELLGAPRRADAHGVPYSGIGTYVVFSVDGDPKVLRALTGDDQLQPQQAAWDAMAATGKPITVTLVTAIFEQNRVVQEGGPFVGDSITVTIAP